LLQSQIVVVASKLPLTLHRFKLLEYGRQGKSNRAKALPLVPVASDRRPHRVSADAQHKPRWSYSQRSADSVGGIEEEKEREKNKI
jgi:hypothetical protein